MNVYNISSSNFSNSSVLGSMTFIFSVSVLVISLTSSLLLKFVNLILLVFTKIPWKLPGYFYLDLLII